MPSARLHRAVTSHTPRSQAEPSFAHRLSARHEPDFDWYDDDPDPFSDESWDPDALDDDEPQPEPGDFWPEIDDD